MKKFNPYEAYALGKSLSPISGWAQQEWTFGSMAWPLWGARESLTLHINAASIFGSATIRAANELIRHINSVIPATFPEIISADQAKAVPAYQLGFIQDAIKNLETVMSNDMPGISSYVVIQKGIYKTEDLIEHADRHFPKEIRQSIDAQAVLDLNEAGKCLAFEVPTACAFHLWRAVETTMASYYRKISKSDFETDKVNRNWAAYIKALNDKGADQKITQFLNYIRESYRNPQTHPEAMLDVNESLGLFGGATSVIHQMVLEIQKP